MPKDLPHTITAIKAVLLLQVIHTQLLSAGLGGAAREVQGLLVLATGVGNFRGILGDWPKIAFTNKGLRTVSKP